MKINWYLLGATLAIAGAGGAKDVFRNDFDMRASEGAVPENRWISYDYVASDAGEVLYYNIRASPATTTSATSIGTAGASM